MFVDEVKVSARAGHGGKGCVAFCREAYRPKGGPDGGNGGRGGDVILEADHDLNNLINQFYQSRLFARDGEYGMGKGMDGHAGKDIIVKVPCGTLVWKLPGGEAPATEEGSAATQPRGRRTHSPNTLDEDSDEPAARPLILSGTSRRPVFRNTAGAPALEINLEDDDSAVADPESDVEQPRELVADLTEHGQRFILCKGGRGGLGNRNFANAVRQSPRFAQPGEAGEQGNYLFELHTIADVGLVGFPNAGKSTLLTAVSKARPRIAAYPFTTLTPQVGIMDYHDFQRIVVCDVPGLIEGAHLDVGLGHAFLRHIERCKFLVLVVDMAGTDGRKPWDDFNQLIKELELYDPELLKKPRLVVANKMDEAVSEANLKSFKRRVRKIRIIPMAAGFDQGLDLFRETVRDFLEEILTAK